jgi:hypothetical protein
MNPSGHYFQIYFKYKIKDMNKADQTGKGDNIPQTGEDIKKGMPERNAMTDKVKNSATQTNGLNQEKTTRDDLFPSDGDNMTNR